LALEKNMAEQKQKYYYRLADVPAVPMTGMVSARFIAGQNILCSFIEQPPGVDCPIHSHPQEQITVVLDGTVEQICDDKRFTLQRGDVCVIPANVKHGGSTQTGFKTIDIFSPPREDYVVLMRNHGASS
jgi:quercetin dioxygenase-like cupin family protein